MRDGDGGFTLVEVLVSLTILAVVAAVAAGVLISVLGSATDDRARVAAANLASRELEIVRAAFESPTQGPQSIPLGQVVNAAPLPGGTAGSPLVVDNKAYTVTRTTEWQAQGATAGPCDGGASGALAYMRVSVLVTWPNMRHTAPVTASTLLAPALGTYNAGTGHIKAKVLDQLGAPETGTTINVTDSSGALVDSQLTASDGCAFFAFLTPGTYTVTATQSGFVDMSWASTSSQSVTVVANAAATVSFAYAAAAQTTLTFDTSQTGYTAPSATGLTVYNPALTPSALHTKTFTPAAPSTTLTTWPYTDGLTAWAGDCTDADPSTGGGSRPSPITTAPGGTATSVIKGAAVSVVVKKSSTPLAGVTVEAVHGTSGCPATMKDPYDNSTTVGEVLRLPVVTDATGTARVLLPYGTWTLKVLTKVASGSWPVINLLSTASYPASYAVTVQ